MERKHTHPSASGPRSRLVFALGIGLLSAALLGAEGDECRPESPLLDRDAYLRTLSLDLRGVTPTLEEHEALASSADVPAELVDEWLASEEFSERAVRHHRALLWPTLSGQRLVHFLRRLSTSGSASDGSLRYYRPSFARYIRGNTVACADEAATFDASGAPVYRTDAAGNQVEGWVEVEPYWAPGTTVHVCAGDAITASTSPEGRDCGSRDSVLDAGCGCGPNLVWCDTSAVEQSIMRAFETDVELRIAANIGNDEPYADLFTSRRGFVNGPIVFFFRNLARIYNSVPMLPAPIDVDRLPNLAFTAEEDWQEIELPAAHSGVLTSVVYLLRFQTNRARANRFYDAFLCQPFQPPNGGLPVADEVEQRQSDLQLRAGCRYCHAILEPAASHWGRWTQQGSGFLDPELYPPFLDECQDCARGDESCSERCRLHYVTRALSGEEESYLGMLNSYEWLRPEHTGNVGEGPSALVRDGLADGRFTSCAVRRTSEWLLGRELEASDDQAVREWTQAFLAGGLRFRALTRVIATSDTYRRVR